MIVGVILRYIKTYRGINYIPLTDEDNFCGLVGDNGIGKSSVLEALDAFFNEKPMNYNVATKKRGAGDTKPAITAVFLIKKSELSPKLVEAADALSNLAWTITEGDFHTAHQKDIKSYIAHRERLATRVSRPDYYLLPVGRDYNGSITLSVFNCRKLVEIVQGEEANASIQSLGEDEVTKTFGPLYDRLKNNIEYIYIPKEIDSESFTKLETAEIQALMGETLNEILEARVTPDQIQEINRNLNSFIESLSAELETYSYRTPTDRQQHLKKQDVYNLIIQAFFNIRKLHKKQGEHWFEISALSSGEKQKAIIDVAFSLIKKHRASAENLIIAVDEPESSLHMSACFDQFDALYEISRNCRQLLFSTHWYGFLPTIESGSATVITKRDGEHYIDLINLAGHREQVKQLTSASRGALPYDVRLKSVNDFVQSIITSVMGDKPFNWLICEGSSEKIYFSAYFKDLIQSKRLRIVPVGGAKEIKRLYQHLSVSYEDFKTEIKGKIILIADTDADLVRYDTNPFTHLICKRIVNDETKKNTELVNISSNPVSPKTELEDALNGKLFFETLKTFVHDYPQLAFLNDQPVATEDPVYFALDLRSSERNLITKFFDSGNNKFVFAQRYVEGLAPEHKTPFWIGEIASWIS